jgi:hypothetical protein
MKLCLISIYCPYFKIVSFKFFIFTSCYTQIYTPIRKLFPSRISNFFRELIISAIDLCPTLFLLIIKYHKINKPNKARLNRSLLLLHSLLQATNFYLFPIIIKLQTLFLNIISPITRQLPLLWHIYANNLLKISLQNHHGLITPRYPFMKHLLTPAISQEAID